MATKPRKTTLSALVELHTVLVDRLTPDGLVDPQEKPGRYWFESAEAARQWIASYNELVCDRHPSHARHDGVELVEVRQLVFFRHVASFVGDYLTTRP